MRNFNFIDLFAGCGGLSEGFYRMGYKALAHVEINPTACQTLRTRMKYYGYENYEDAVLEMDITRDDVIDRINDVVKNDKVDIIIGGPPCQAYSSLGRAKDDNAMQDDPRNFLFESYVKVLNHYSPKFFVFENVTGILYNWNRETAFNLNRMEPDMNGFVYHPLFAEETFYEETDCEYPQEVTRIVFNSKTFGPKTYIAGDCFNLRLKNGTTLYLMDIEKSVHKVGDPSAAAKEAWMYVPSKGSQLLVASQDDTPVAPFLELLFSTVKERMEHPKVNKDVMYVIDSFMKDDIKDDDTDECPF